MLINQNCLLKPKITFQTSLYILVLGTCKGETGKCEINEDDTGQRGTNWKAEGRNWFIEQSKHILSYIVLYKEEIKAFAFSVLFFRHTHPVGKVRRKWSVGVSLYLCNFSRGMSISYIFSRWLLFVMINSHKLCVTEVPKFLVAISVHRTRL